VGEGVTVGVGVRVGREVGVGEEMVGGTQQTFELSGQGKSRLIVLGEVHACRGTQVLAGLAARQGIGVGVRVGRTQQIKLSPHQRVSSRDDPPKLEQISLGLTGETGKQLLLLPSGKQGTVRVGVGVKVGSL